MDVMEAASALRTITFSITHPILGDQRLAEPRRSLILFCTASAGARHFTESGHHADPLLRTYLARYQRPIVGLLILSLAGTMAALLLPSLNAAIIDEGVAKGDTATSGVPARSCSASRWYRSAAPSGPPTWAQNGDELRP